MLHDGHDVGTRPRGRGKNTGVKHPQRLPRGCTFEQIGQKGQSIQTPSHRHLQERVRKSTGGQRPGSVSWGQAGRFPLSPAWIPLVEGVLSPGEAGGG